MSEERPSIAELQQFDRQGVMEPVLDAHPVLLEIAAAALARQEAMDAIESGKTDDWDAVWSANGRMGTALAKVRP